MYVLGINIFMLINKIQPINENMTEYYDLDYNMYLKFGELIKYYKGLEEYNIYIDQLKKACKYSIKTSRRLRNIKRKGKNVVDHFLVEKNNIYLLNFILGIIKIISNNVSPKLEVGIILESMSKEILLEIENYNSNFYLKDIGWEQILSRIQMQEEIDIMTIQYYENNKLFDNSFFNKFFKWSK